MSFLPGEAGGVKRCFNITVVDDVIVEDDEYFSLMIQPSSADESSVQVSVPWMKQKYIGIKFCQITPGGYGRGFHWSEYSRRLS